MSSTTPSRSTHPKSLWDGWWSQQAVLHALLLREIQSRFGRHNIGFLWMILEPLMLATVITLIHTMVEHSLASSEIGPYPFTVLGYCLIMIFRNSFSRAESALGSAPPLMYHRQITPFDIMVARTTVEVFGALSSMTILMVAGYFIGLVDFPARPIFLFSAICAIIVFSFGLSLCVAALSHRFHLFGRFVQPMAYFSWPLSGAFFTVNFLPVAARETVTWVPLVSMFEMARFGMFAPAQPHYMYPEYVLASCIVVMLLGLIAIRWIRRHIGMH